MVVHDKEFNVDLTLLSDEELKKKRLFLVKRLFNGDKGSRDNVEKEALIKEIDIEREMRFKKKAEERSNLALIISVCALFLSIISLIIKYIL
jgi:hypothetical protein